jgi:hypothetical protein
MPGASWPLISSPGEKTSTIVPRREDIDKLDALDDIKQVSVDYIITNPPWSRDLLHRKLRPFAPDLASI